MSLVNPTRQFYEYLDQIAERFNSALFNGGLPKAVFTLRAGRSGLGHFVAKGWSASGAERVGEIRLNPNLFAQCSWVELLQTIARAQCDLWQHAYGSPSRPGYRNAEWAQKMNDIGLVPTSTGQPGGRQTGQGLTSYPEPGGLFARACAALAAEAHRPPLTRRWLKDLRANAPAPELGVPARLQRRLLAPVGRAVVDEALANQLELCELKRKVKYTCLKCGMNVWGRSNLQLLCAGCGTALRQIINASSSGKANGSSKRPGRKSAVASSAR